MGKNILKLKEVKSQLISGRVSEPAYLTSESIIFMPYVMSHEQ